MSPPGVNLNSLRLEGTKVRSDVAEAIQSADIERTIDGAPTLTVTLIDTNNRILRSGLFGSRVTSQVADLAFELVQVNKSGNRLTVTFEDLAVAALRRHSKPVKVAGGTTTRVEFAKRLVAEEPWIPFRAPPIPLERAKVEMARGTMPDGDDPGEPEDTWAALGRLADEVGWTRFSRHNDVWFVPESFLFLGDPEITLVENHGPTHTVDFDFDIGKPVATATVTVDAERWIAPPGTLVWLGKAGPATGKWLVESISRSLFSTRATIGLRLPTPVLPEPDPPPAPTADELGDGEGSPTGGGSGGRISIGAKSSGGYVWPLRGRISSGYGQRNGRLHAGIDIAVSVGTAIAATKAGTVIFAGTAGGYGFAVYIDHGGVISRYGHLSKIECRRGQVVETGQRIGLSGGARGSRGAGNSQGPHLHFEIRPGDSPADPRRYLP